MLTNYQTHTSLVGGFEHFLCFHILGTIIPIDFHIFLRCRYTTNQICINSDTIIWMLGSWWNLMEVDGKTHRTMHQLVSQLHSSTCPYFSLPRSCLSRLVAELSRLGYPNPLLLGVDSASPRNVGKNPCDVTLRWVGGGSSECFGYPYSQKMGSDSELGRVSEPHDSVEWYLKPMKTRRLVILVTCVLCIINHSYPMKTTVTSDKQQISKTIIIIWCHWSYCRTPDGWIFPYVFLYSGNIQI